MKKQIIFLLILSCLCSNISSQIITGTHPLSHSSGQNQMTEKVYLHVDRSTYNPEDDIWFKAYVIDPSTNLLSHNTNNLHIELISAGGEIIQSRTLRIESGLGKGDFKLLESTPSGIYRFRAYTNHMRNYGDENFYVKEITVVSPYDEDKKQTGSVQNKEEEIDISFFPEGGSLVDNVRSKVAFKAVNAMGLGCDVKLEIHSSEGELISQFKSTHLGMGYFNFQPLPGFTYYAIVKSANGAEKKADLPKSFPAGVTMRTFITEDKELILTVSTNEETFSSLKGKDITIALSSRNLINQIVTIRLDSLENNYLIPVEIFPVGIIKISLSVNERLPLCERLVYIQKSSDVQLSIITDKKEYSPREKIEAVVSLSGDSPFSGSGDFSFSAAEAIFSSNPSLYPTTISSWFLLESDVRGSVEEPSYYFDPSNKERLADLDLLLLTQGWRDFQWKYDSIQSFSHEIGFTITGKVQRVLGKKPVKGTKINLGIFTNDAHQYLISESNEEGSFTFKDLDFTGQADIFVSSTDKNERMEGEISVDSRVYIPPEPGILDTRRPELEVMPEKLAVLKQEASIKLNIKKKYKLSDTIDIGEVIITAKRAETVQEVQVNDSRRTYGSPDKEMVVSEGMENFSGDVFQMIAGRIPGLQVVRGVNVDDPNYPMDVKVIIRNQGGIEGGGALILLDGLLMDSPGDISNILSLPAFMIDRVDVLNSSPAYGMSGANGVINIITRREMRRVLAEPRPNTTSFKLTGFDAPRIFYSPKHDTPKDPSYTPDTRTTIFWEPNITIEKNKKATLEFYNADNPTSINITVEGITEEGIPVSSRVTYKVR